MVDSFEIRIEESWKDSFRFSLIHYLDLIENNKTIKKHHFENDLASFKEILKLKDDLSLNCVKR